MNRIFFKVLVVLALIIITSCRENKKIAIVVTTDVHGRIFPGSGTDNSLASIPALVKELEGEGYHVVLMDNGDILQGDPIVYRSNYVDTADVNIVARVLNYLDYKAQTLGNHDIETGHPVYDKYVSEINMPALAANAISVETGDPYFKPFAIIEADGVKIGVLGLVTPWIPNWLPPALYEGMRFDGMVESAERFMPALQAEKPDVTVGLFHSGWDGNSIKADEKNSIEENGSARTIYEVPGFDLLFIGHDHRNFVDTLKTKEGKEIPVLDGGSYSRYASVAKIGLSRSFLKKWKIDYINPELADLENYEADKEFLAYFSSDISDVDDYISSRIGFLENDLNSRSCWYGPNSILSLIHRIQMETTSAPISIAAPLSFDVVLPAGELKMEQMFQLYRYENYLNTISLTGAEIDRFLEYSYSLWVKKMDSKESLMLNLSTDPEGKPLLSRGRARFSRPYYNFDSAEGIDYTVDLRKDKGERISITKFSNGAPFFADSTYTVVMNSYRANGGGGHLTEGVGLTPEEISSRIISSTDRDFRYYIGVWFAERERVKVDVKQNWTFIPQEWARAASTRESVLIYGPGE